MLGVLTCCRDIGKQVSNVRNCARTCQNSMRIWSEEEVVGGWRWTFYDELETGTSQPETACIQAVRAEGTSKHNRTEAFEGVLLCRTYNSTSADSRQGRLGDSCSASNITSDTRDEQHSADTILLPRTRFTEFSTRIAV